MKHKSELTTSAGKRSSWKDEAIHCTLVPFGFFFCNRGKLILCLVAPSPLLVVVQIRQSPNHRFHRQPRVSARVVVNAGPEASAIVKLTRAFVDCISVTPSRFRVIPRRPSATSSFTRVYIPWRSRQFASSGAAASRSETFKSRRLRGWLLKRQQCSYFGRIRMYWNLLWWDEGCRAGDETRVNK